MREKPNGIIQKNYRYRLVFAASQDNGTSEYIDLQLCGYNKQDGARSVSLYLLSENMIDNTDEIEEIEHTLDSYHLAYIFWIEKVSALSYLDPRPNQLIIYITQIPNYSAMFFDDQRRIYVPISEMPDFNRDYMHPISFYRLPYTI